MNQDQPATQPRLTSEDYYFENDLMVFTAAYHLKRGSCCKSACRHCPYGFRGQGKAIAAPPSDACKTSEQLEAKS
jgi:hypothetical protein